MLFRFDDFELDTDRFELRQNGLVRHVEPLVFDLICFFSRNPGRVIDRDEIIEQIWNGRIVSDATVSSCIKSARRTLGDSGDKQSHIRTVRGRGFQFVGRVNAVEKSNGNSRPAGSQTMPGNPESDGSSGTSTAPQDQASQPPDPLPGRREKPVLAVLPFNNLSAGVEEYFADGLTEDIITNLSRFRDLMVIGRTSTFQYKGRAINPSQLCAELKAGYVVEGSVRRAAGRVRITAQLIDGETGVPSLGRQL